MHGDIGTHRKGQPPPLDRWMWWMWWIWGGAGGGGWGWGNMLKWFSGCHIYTIKLKVVSKSTGYLKLSILPVG